MTPRLIALCSSAMGSGKSTVAAHLVENHGFVHLAFATPLKQMTVALLKATGMSQGDITEHVYGSRKEDIIPALGVSSRRVQQTLGTEWGRKLIAENLWVDITMAAANALISNGESVVIDDMRFPNEFRAVDMHPVGSTWRIVRPDAKVTLVHESEGQLDRIHMREIFNNGSIAELHALIDRLIAAH
jgi:hypothetical protein